MRRLTFLEQVGLIQHVSPVGGIANTFEPDSNGNAALFEGDLCLRVQLQGPVQLGIIPITRIGQEIARILSPVNPLAVLKRVAQALHREAAALDIRRVLAIDHRGARLSDPIEVLKSAYRLKRQMSSPDLRLAIPHALAQNEWGYQWGYFLFHSS